MTTVSVPNHYFARFLNTLRPISALLKPPFFGVSNYFPSRIVFPARPSQSDIAHALGLVRAPSPPERLKTNDEEKVSRHLS